MGGFSFILLITALSSILGFLLPFGYMFDLFFIAAVYITLFSRLERTLFTVWGLGLIKGAFSLSPIYCPLFFVGMYILLTFIRDHLNTEHPLTRFVTLFAISIIYTLLDVIGNAAIFPFSDRLYFFWTGIIVISLMNGLFGILFFRLFSVIPIRAVSQTKQKAF